MPARMYKYCTPEGAHPISISSDLIIESDRQLQDYLLCCECEDNLNRGGETWLLPLLSQYKGPFPFYDLLTKVPPDAVDGDAAVYAASKNPDIHVDKLTHFAMGVFWKAAVHPWCRSSTEPMIDLGCYAEPVRQFLRGEASFPDHVALTIGVLPPPAQLISFHNPYQGSKKEWNNFLLYVSGIEFCLAVGSAVDATLKENCFASNPAHPIVVVDFSSSILEILSSVWANARKAKNIEKWLKRLP